jgi:UDPglucose--hexose-1-phosphate uridylyltransferase
MVTFKRTVQSGTYLNPFSEFAEYEGKVEIRWDPLTRMTTRLVHFPARKIDRFDYTEAIAVSLAAKCPFCPENIAKMTARLRRDIFSCDRLEKDGVTVIPNLLTFDRYSLVAILSPKHFVGLPELAETNLMLKGIAGLLEAFGTIKKHDREVEFFSINCNYMPMSGSSILHPHIQGVAGRYPTNHLRMMLEEGKNFYKSKLRVFWEALVEEEKATGERFIGTKGKTHWYAPFAPRGNIDVGCIFEKTSLFEINDDEWQDFGSGLFKVLTYLDREHVSSFNLAIFSGPSEEKSFRVNARIVARRFLPPVNAADVNYFDKLHLESVVLVAPEEIAQDLRTLW